MSLADLAELIHTPGRDRWGERNRCVFDRFFGAPGGRYEKRAENAVKLRTAEFRGGEGVPFAAWIHPSNPDSGPYGGLSFVIFPAEDHPCLIGMVVGTQGLAPDEAVLGRPGHARKMQAICAWLNRKQGGGRLAAWAKQDPTRTDIGLPDDLARRWSPYKEAFERYGRFLYALYVPGPERAVTEEATAAFLDVLFEERGYAPLVACQSHADQIRREWSAHLLPAATADDVKQLLLRRRYVIIQGPPGTGKTRMARQLLLDAYGGFGRSIQFHPNTCYENFIGGLAPRVSPGELGFRFEPAPGALMEAAMEALREPERPYLLHIDEINRADLSKVLGEAIFLLEAAPEARRTIRLPYDFGDPFHREFYLPENLHILGTMNSADRSIAIVDIAVRRRFAFVNLWPRPEVVRECGSPKAQEAFQRLFEIFVEYASEEAFVLMPGHAYFLEADAERTAEILQVQLAPLLEEYLAQGYASGFAESLRSYLQWLRAL